MYEQLSLFDGTETIVQKKSLFEQVFPVIDDPVSPCVNCLCQYCTRNAEELYHTVKLEESAEEPCFICDECLEYTGDVQHKICQKTDCEDFILSDYGAERNRRKLNVIILGEK